MSPSSVVIFQRGRMPRPRTARKNACDRCQQLTPDLKVLLHDLVDRLRATTMPYVPPPSDHLIATLKRTNVASICAAIAIDAVIVLATTNFARTLGYEVGELVGAHVSLLHAGPIEIAPMHHSTQSVVALRRKDGAIVRKRLTRLPLIVGEHLAHLGIIEDLVE